MRLYHVCVVIVRTWIVGVYVMPKLCSYGCALFSNEWCGFVWVLAWLLVLCAWPEMKPCKFRPSESHSPKRELQNLVSSFGSRFSLGRPVSVLSDRYSRLGERGSPKWGRDEACKS